MRAIGRVQLTTTELPDALEFDVVREFGWLELVLGLGITLGTIWMFWRVNATITHVIVGVIGAIAAAAVIVTLIQGRSTKLLVESDEISAQGNINKVFSTNMRIPVAEVKWIGYEPGSDNEPSGLYLRHGWKRSCLLPGLDEDQGLAVVGTIFAKFPEIVPGDKSGGSLFFGNESGLTGLGLSDSRREEPKTGE